MTSQRTRSAAAKAEQEWDALTRKQKAEVLVDAVLNVPPTDEIAKAYAASKTEQEKKIMSEANPKQAFGDLKVPLQFIPPTAIVALGIGLAEGGRKYGPFNWRDIPVEYMTYAGAVQRHLQAWIDGQDFDPDSGNPHLYHAIASLAILIDAVVANNFQVGKHIDNRPPSGAAAAMLSAFTGRGVE